MHVYEDILLPDIVLADLVGQRLHHRDHGFPEIWTTACQRCLEDCRRSSKTCRTSHRRHLSLLVGRNCRQCRRWTGIHSYHTRCPLFGQSPSAVPPPHRHRHPSHRLQRISALVFKHDLWRNMTWHGMAYYNEKIWKYSLPVLRFQASQHTVGYSIY